MTNLINGLTMADIVAGESFDYKKYIIIGVAAVVVIVAMVAISIISKKKNK